MTKLVIYSDFFIDADLEGKESPVTTELLPSEGEGEKILLNLESVDKILTVNQFWMKSLYPKLVNIQHLVNRIKLQQLDSTWNSMLNVNQ